MATPAHLSVGTTPGGKDDAAKADERGGGGGGRKPLVKGKSSRVPEKGKVKVGTIPGGKNDAAKMLERGGGGGRKALVEDISTSRKACGVKKDPSTVKDKPSMKGKVGRKAVTHVTSSLKQEAPSLDSVVENKPLSSKWKGMGIRHNHDECMAENMYTGRYYYFGFSEWEELPTGKSNIESVDPLHPESRREARRKWLKESLFGNPFRIF